MLCCTRLGKGMVGNPGLVQERELQVPEQSQSGLTEVTAEYARFGTKVQKEIAQCIRKAWKKGKNKIVIKTRLLIGERDKFLSAELAKFDAQVRLTPNIFGSD